MSTLSERIAARQAAVAANGAAKPAAGFTADIKADDFTALCELVRRLCGVDLVQYKRGQMERRVRTFAQRRGTPELGAYGERLKADKDELDAFLDRVTINVSQLWRNPEQWVTLADKIFPDLEASAPVRGRILCEAESTCTVYGMPRAVVEAKLVDDVLPLHELAHAIAEEAGS